MRLAKAWPEGPLVLGHDNDIAKFVAQRSKYMLGGFGLCTAIGVIRHNKLIGGVVYHEYKDAVKSIMVSFAFDHPSWITPSVLGSICAYPFIQIGANRVSALVAKKNKRSRKFVEGIGFKLEGCARRAFLDDDAMLYGLLRRECRWIKD